MPRRRGATNRRQQKREYGPWLRRITVLAGIAMLLAVVGRAGFWFFEAETMPVRSVLIQGKMMNVSKDEIRQVVIPHVEGGFLRVDISVLRSAIEAMPWVYHASVRRKWPASLQVQITEQQAVARWGDDGLINQEGGVFKAKAEGAQLDLPLLNGPEKSEKAVVRRYAEMQQLLKPLGLGVQNLNLNQRRAWQLTLNNGVTLLLGRKEGYQRMLRFVGVYPRVMADRIGQARQIDLRYTNGFAVSWSEEPEAA